MPSINRPLVAKCPESFVDTLVGTFGAANWTGDTIQWRSPVGRLVAQLHDVEAITLGRRRASGAITVAQELVLPSPGHAKLIASRLNMAPGLGIARIATESPSVVHVVSRASFFRDERKEQYTLGMLLATAAICHMVASLDFGAGPPVKRLPQHDQPCRWPRAEFIGIAWMIKCLGNKVSMRRSHCIGELKSFTDWLPQVPNNGDPRLVISGECSHESFGKGLGVELSLGLGLPPAKGRQLAQHLNDLELRRVVGPPVFGAWRMDSASRRVLFGSFWPNVSYVPNLMPRIAAWSADRLAMIKDTVSLFIGCPNAALANRPSDGFLELGESG